MYVHGAHQGRQYRRVQQRAAAGRVVPQRTAGPLPRSLPVRPGHDARPVDVSRWKAVWGQSRVTTASMGPGAALDGASTPVHPAEGIAALALVSAALCAGCASGRPVEQDGFLSVIWDQMTHLKYYVREGKWDAAAMVFIGWVVLIGVSAVPTIWGARELSYAIPPDLFRPVVKRAHARWSRTVGIRRGKPEAVMGRLLAAAKAAAGTSGLNRVLYEIEGFVRDAMRTGHVSSVDAFLLRAAADGVLPTVGGAVWQSLRDGLNAIKASGRRDTIRWTAVHALADRLRPVVEAAPLGIFQLGAMLSAPDGTFSDAAILTQAAALSAMNVHHSDGLLDDDASRRLLALLDRQPSTDPACELRLVQAYLTGIASGSGRVDGGGSRYLVLSEMTTPWWNRVMGALECLQQAGRWVESQALLAQLKRIPFGEKTVGEERYSALDGPRKRQNAALLEKLVADLDATAAQRWDAVAAWAHVEAARRAVHNRYKSLDQAVFERRSVLQFVAAVLRHGGAHQDVLAEAMRQVANDHDPWAVAILGGRIHQANTYWDLAYGKLVESFGLAQDAAQRELTTTCIEDLFTHIAHATGGARAAPEWSARYAHFLRLKLHDAVQGLDESTPPERLDRVAALIDQLRPLQ